MADNNDIDASVSTELPEQTLKADSKPSYGLLFAIIIALMMALGATLMSWQSLRLERQQQLNANQFAKQWQASKTALQTSLTDVKQQLKAVLNQRHEDRQDWVLLKAKYYLELAQINAQWSESQATTMALLEQADRILQPLSLPAMLPIRQAIAHDLARLKSLPIVDMAGLLSQLDAIQSQVAQLSMKQTHQVVAENTDSGDKTTPSAWRVRLRESMSMLEKLVVITHQDDGLQPMLSPLHQTILRESLRLNLQTAEWAVLQQNSAIYQQSLAKAIKELKRNFENHAARQALITQLQALQQQNLSMPKPPVPQALLLLNQLINNAPSHSDTAVEVPL